MNNLFVINPAAGKGKKVLQYIELIKNHCENEQENFDIYITKSQGDATSYVKHYLSQKQGCNIFACGGDGTLYEVVNGIYGNKNAKVGVLPLGSGNDFVRLFGNKENFLDVKKQLYGKTARFDLIKCENRLALSQCSVGFDAKVCMDQKSIKKIPFVSGELAFGISAIKCLTKDFSSELKIVVDDNRVYKDDYVLCLAANSKWYGGGFLAAPDANISDGLIDLVLIKKPKGGRLELLKLLPKYKKGNHLSHKAVEVIRCKKAVVSSVQKQAINIDGECYSSNKSEFQIIPNAIDFIVPHGSERRI